ncbi:hypothetical protein DJ568_05950 [Mucilaginibacter hurinus]|uniref:Uncharacterized protein n=1 Tax=Mucilaginibacter hurinus TaxID=2201324 RepID=A0A367GQT2_9SPHI|nr:hypothetical protein [Mucilaginibacter hurinus]RCH55435.1 hypothetical protein DJ568_05950 [Mucilaginibacter hurinus]
MELHLNLLKRVNLFRIFFIFLIGLFYSACNQPQKTYLHEFVSFKEVNGIYFTEVHRRSANGLSFDKYGFQQEPQWRMRFLSDDSVSIYSPDKKRYLNFLLSRGYDSVFNTARAWLKMKKISKDSLVFQLLSAKNNELDTRGEDVYMTLYADNYIKNVLHTTPEILQRPTRKDSLFIKSLVDKATKNHDSTFAARNPVEFVSATTLIQVAQRKSVPDFLANNFNVSADYFDPVYDITINNTSRNFFYTFTIIVDQTGKMHYGKPLVSFLDDKDMEASYIKNSTLIMEGYLAKYLHVKPGSTLGMPHASRITVNIKGVPQK